MKRSYQQFECSRAGGTQLQFIQMLQDNKNPKAWLEDGWHLTPRIKADF